MNISLTPEQEDAAENLEELRHDMGESVKEADAGKAVPFDQALVDRVKAEGRAALIAGEENGTSERTSDKTIDAEAEKLASLRAAIAVSIEQSARGERHVLDADDTIARLLQRLEKRKS